MVAVPIEPTRSFQSSGFLSVHPVRVHAVRVRSWKITHDSFIEAEHAHAIRQLSRYFSYGAVALRQT